MAIASDAPTLARMNSQLIRDEGHRNNMSLPELEARMAEWLANEYEAFLFEDEHATVGYALFRREPEYVYLRQFFIEPSRRRLGHGAAAISWLHTHAWRNGRVRIEVLVGNAVGLAFWQAVGFRDYCITMEMDAAVTM